MSTGPLARQACLACDPQGIVWHSLEEWGRGHAGGSAPFPPTREPRGPRAGQACAPPCAGGDLPHSPQGPSRLSLAWWGLKPCNRPQSDMARQSHRTLVLGPFSVQCVAPGTCLWTWPLSEQNWGCSVDRLSRPGHQLGTCHPEPAQDHTLYHGLEPGSGPHRSLYAPGGTCHGLWVHQGLGAVHLHALPLAQTFCCK